MIQGVIKAFKNSGTSEQSGVHYCECIIESKDGELFSCVAFRDDALALQQYEIGQEIKACGQKKRGEEQFIISYSERVARRDFNAFQESQDEAVLESKRKEIIEKLGVEHRADDIEAIMDHFGAGEVTAELRKLGFLDMNKEKAREFKTWKEEMLKAIFENKKMETEIAL